MHELGRIRSGSLAAVFLLACPGLLWAVASFSSGSPAHLRASDSSPSRRANIGNHTQFLCLGWVRWNDAHFGGPKYVWAESGPDPSRWIALGIENGTVYYEHSSSERHPLHVPLLGQWYFYVVEVNGSVIQAWVGDPAGILSKVLDGAALTPRPLVDTVTLGGLGGPDAQVAQAELLYWAGFRSHATSAADRATLFNGGNPSLAPMVLWIENTTPIQPWYFHDFSQPAALKANSTFPGFSEVGGSVAFTSAQAFWGMNRTVSPAEVMDIPDLQALWTFQDGPDVAPVDLVHGYALAKGSARWPRSTLGGGVFGDRALLFTGEEYLIIQDENAPAIDIAGPQAQVSVVAWYRDFQTSVACASLVQMWPEQGQRQYALLRSLNAAQRRDFVGHVCSYNNHGGRSFNDYYNQAAPPFYNFEWATSGWTSWNLDFVMHVGVMTYDGTSIRVFRDGTYTWVSYGGGSAVPPAGMGTRGPRNPYISGDGGGISDVNSEFTIGARVTQTPGSYTEYLTGHVGGVAIFSRALTLREVASLAGVPGPSTSIDTPDAMVVQYDQPLALSASVSHGGHANAVTRWTSSLDGLLGVGSAITVSGLSLGTHVITAETEEPASSTVPNTGAGLLDRDSITVEIQGPLYLVDGREIPHSFGSNAWKTAQNRPSGLLDNVNELNQLFVAREADGIRVGMTGNISPDGSGLVLLLDTKSGGRNPLDLSEFLPEWPEAAYLNGMVLDSRFRPNHLMYVRAEQDQIDVTLMTLIIDGPGAARWLGSSAIGVGNGELVGGDNANDTRVALDNSNVEGVSADGVSGAETATSGCEMLIRYADLDMIRPVGRLRALALLVDSNGEPLDQFLPGLGTGFVVPGSTIDLSGIDGWQFLAVPLMPGDDNGDGVIDLFDFDTLGGALHGPGYWLLDPSDVIFDSDRDGDVDLADYADFQRRFGGIR